MLLLTQIAHAHEGVRTNGPEMKDGQSGEISS
jgi:hypothetical protein